MFARFNENQAMTLQDIKETKCYGRTDARMDGRTDNVKTVYPLQTKFAGGIIIDTEAIIRSQIQHFEADFLWKVSLKILNSGMILKTFTAEANIF